MLKLLTSASLATALLVTAANAQSTAPAPSPSSPPAGKVEVKPPVTPEAGGPSNAAKPSPAMPSATSPSRDSAAAPSPSTPGMGVKLTDAEAEKWINKGVYSSDDKNLGEISGFMRAADGTVQELHADIGGFLGIGETRVRIMPSQFKLGDDRVILNITSEQAKTLPQLSK